MTQDSDPARLKAAYEECRTITKKEASNFYYAFLALPRHRRKAIYAVYAFSRLADDIADRPGSTKSKHKGLTELRRRLEEAYSGRPHGPIFEALADASERYEINRVLFENVIDGVSMDLERNRISNFEELNDYCYHVASAVGLISIQVFGHQDDPRVHDYAVDLGLAMQLTNILRDIREDAERDRIYLPQDEMARFGYSEDNLRNQVLNDRFRSLMRFQVNRARMYFDSGTNLFPFLESESRACAEGLHRIYSRILDKIALRGFDVFTERIGLSPWEKIRMISGLWATSRLTQVLGR